MIVEQSRFGFRKAFVPNDTEAAVRLARERQRYGRIIVMSLEPLVLPGFKERIASTGVIWLESDLDTVLGRFRKTVRNEISRTYRDDGLSFAMSPSVTDEGYALLCRFLKARGMPMSPRSAFAGCVEFLAYMEGEPVSGILLYPSAPVPVVAAIFSSRRYAANSEEYKRIGYASKRVIAEVCKWGLARGLKGIDLSSLDANSTTVPGITEYKSSFGPVLVKRYEYVYRSATFKFFENVMIRIRVVQRSVYRLAKKHGIR